MCVGDTDTFFDIILVFMSYTVYGSFLKINNQTVITTGGIMTISNFLKNESLNKYLNINTKQYNRDHNNCFRNTTKYFLK